MRFILTTKNQLSKASLQFDDNRLLPVLYGEHNKNLRLIETLCDVQISSRGNEIFISGNTNHINQATHIFETIWDKVQSGIIISTKDIDTAYRFLQQEEDNTMEKPKQTTDSKGSFTTYKNQPIEPRSPNQALYLNTIKKNELVFGIGPAGTGKTYLAVAAAVAMFKEGIIDKMVFCRPAVEAGERLGFLPGDMMDKVDPYLRPIYDALHDMMPADKIAKKIEIGEIEIAPLAFMRGRTLKNAFVVLDEAQNTTSMQMKMFLTRMGEGTRMIITGDPTQIDLPNGEKSGLKEAMSILRNVNDIPFVHFDSKDVVRHKLVSKIIKAYDQHDFRNN